MVIPSLPAYGSLPTTKGGMIKHVSLNTTFTGGSQNHNINSIISLHVYTNRQQLLSLCSAWQSSTNVSLTRLVSGTCTDGSQDRLQSLIFTPAVVVPATGKLVAIQTVKCRGASAENIEQTS